MAQQEIDVAIDRALQNYIIAIKPLGVVTEVIFALKPGEPAQAVNVTKTDSIRERADDPRYSELRRFEATFMSELGSILQIFVSNTGPSKLESFLEDAKIKGFELKRFPVTLDILPQ